MAPRAGVLYLSGYRGSQTRSSPLVSGSPGSHPLEVSGASFYLGPGLPDSIVSHRLRRRTMSPEYRAPNPIVFTSALSGAPDPHPHLTSRELWVTMRTRAPVIGSSCLVYCLGGVLLYLLYGYISIPILIVTGCSICYFELFNFTPITITLNH